MVVPFKTEGAEFQAYIAANPDSVLIRMPEGVLVLTGQDKADYEAGQFRIPPFPAD